MELKKQIASLIEKGVFHILLGSFLTRFVSFFASIVVVRILSKVEYGILSYYENLYSYFFLLAGYGLTNAVLRYVVISDTKNEKRSVLSYCKRNGSIFNIVLTIVGIIFTFLYKHPAQFVANKYFLVIMLIFLPFQYITNLYILNERAFYDNKRYAFVSFLYSLMLIVFKLIGSISWKLIGAAFFPLIIHFVYSVVLQVLDNKKYFSDVSEELYALPKDKKRIIDKYAIQYMITNGLWAVFALNSTFILGRYIGDAELMADYRIATVLPSLVSIISTSIGIFIGPYFTRREVDGDIGWIKRNWLKMMFTSIILIGIAVFVLFLCAPYAIRLVFGAKYDSSFPIMRLLLISSFLDAGIRYPTANLMAAMNRIKYNMIVSFIGIITQIFLATFLANKYSIVGIAMSNIIVQIIMSLLVNFFFILCFFYEKNKRV